MMKRLKFAVALCALLVMGSFIAQSVLAVEPCCTGTRGNANADPDDKVNISDVTYLTSYLFGIPNGPAPLCVEEGNVNGDPEEKINISDVTYLVSYLFGIPAGPAPGDCPAGADIVFDDEYGNYVTYEAFAGSKADAVQLDAVNMHAGTQGLIVTIPDVGDPSGSYSGGAFTTTAPRDLTEFNALTFWAKANKVATLDVVGIGNDNTGTSKYTAQMNNLALSTTWQKYTIPFPLPEKLSSEAGLFFFAEGPEGGLGYQIWIDEIIFQNLYDLSNVRAEIVTETFNVEIGANITPSNGTMTVAVGAEDVSVSAMPGYFTFMSSDEAVVTVAGDGTITAVGEGTATLTAMLGATAATGQITVNVSGPTPEPGTPASTPTADPADVISLFSDAYTDVPVNTWSTDWDAADVEDYMIGADNTKKYTNLSFAGIEFTSPTVDASAMTHFHMDVWTPDPTDAPAVFKIKLVDFGADGSYGGGDDSEHEITLNESTMNTESWVGIDLPLSAFSGLTGKAHLAQMIISGDPNTVYLDNIYFYDAGLPTEPAAPAPTPTAAPGDVISLFSDAYTNVTVDTWSANWPDMADVADVMIGSDNAKLYTNLVFAGIEFTSSPIDASAMSHFHMDVWTPDATDAPAVFKIKLVDFGPNGIWGGGDDSEHEVTLDETTMNTGEWVSIDIPLADFTGLAERAHLAQMVITSDPNTVWVDNVYFYYAGATEPISPAPTPTADPGDVISMFSDAYTNVTVDTWSANWPDQADVADVTIGADNAKLYTNLVFAGIEFTSSPIDASAMTHFHMDVWTPDPTDAPAVFKIKLVDFGPNGVWGADDSEYEITLDETTMNTGSWVSIDIPLDDFVGLAERAHLAQMIISGDPNTVWVDNVYFYFAGATEPAAPAPAPTFDASSVISLFSDAYTDVTVDTWSADWPDMADVADVMVGSDNAKLYTNLVYAGIEFATSTIDASSMTNFHMDVWTPDATDAPAVFKIKLVDFGPNGVWGTDDSEYEITLDETTMNTGSWVSIDIPLDDFTGLAERAHLAQMIISSDPNTVWIDNVYLYSTVPVAPAATPILGAADVISLFSDAYTDVTVDTWSADWPDMADVADVTIGADNAKLYTNLVYAGVEFVSSPIDASTMTHFHMDVWTPDPTAAPAVFKIKLVDFGLDGVWGTDDSESEVTLDEVTMKTGGWVSIEIPMSSFSGLAGTTAMAQMIISGDPNTVWVDNVYFHK